MQGTGNALCRPKIARAEPTLQNQMTYKYAAMSSVPALSGQSLPSPNLQIQSQHGVLQSFDDTRQYVML
jgi:hypothetical protein